MPITDEMIKKAAQKAGGSLSKITLKVIKDYNCFNNAEFVGKYYCTKPKYLKRVLRYGDPYMRAPLARLAKLFSKISSKL